MRWLWILLLAPAIAFAGVGSIEHNEGRTWNERSNKTENIGLGYDVLMDDFYQTGEDGQIGIIFADETSITVIENSELLIDEFTYDPETSGGSNAFTLTVTGTTIHQYQPKFTQTGSYEYCATVNLNNLSASDTSTTTNASGGC